MTPAYIQGSIAGRTFSPTHSIRFRATFPGMRDMAHAPQHAEQHLHPLLRGGDKTEAGIVDVQIGLPRPGTPAHLLMEINISSDAQGVCGRRAPTPVEIQAIFAHWEDLRDAAILDADTTACRQEPISQVVEAFAHAASVITAPKLRTRRQHTNDPSAILLAGAGTPTRTLRPIPALPSNTKKAAQAPQATPLQAAIQQAISETEGDLAQMGNGYAWAVEQVAQNLLAAMQPHVPGIDPKDYAFNP